jgi:hypothetical protein
MFVDHKVNTSPFFLKSTFKWSVEHAFTTVLAIVSRVHFGSKIYFSNSKLEKLKL